MRILENINGHEDLVKLNDQQRSVLCDEIRDFLVNSVARTGGHLASNLGTVELTVAIETVFNTMKDRLVFDVGHQSYVHKLLTGRQADFEHLRQYQGLSGFPKPAESISDSFVAGHASSSVSIALGMARARTLLKDDYHVIALIGDGAVTGGMAYEGLNDAAVSKEPMIIILNDNDMSIDRNVGGMAKHLSRLRSSEEYLRLKLQYRTFLKNIPGGRKFYSFSSKVKNRIKRFVLSSTIFENMGLTYLGPIDGHNLPELIDLLRVARDLKAPVLIHVITKKGFGYKPAEADPSKFHGIGKFDPLTGESASPPKPTFSDAFGKAMTEIARENPRLCAITAAMPGGTGLLNFRNEFPKRLFDVGIAEEHAVSLAGGLAKQGMIPVVALYSTFLQRSFDQIMHDVGLLGLHVVFAVDRAGLVGEDGPTHHGVFDVAILRQVPNITILCPASYDELEEHLRWAIYECQGPVAIRYPRGSEDTAASCPQLAQPQCDANIVRHRIGGDVTLITYGTLTKNVVEAAEILSSKGIEAQIIRLKCIWPLSVASLKKTLSHSGRIFVIEEMCSESGIGQSLAWLLRKEIPTANIDSIDLGSHFPVQGATPTLYKHYGLDAQSISDHIQEVLSNEN